MKEGGLEKLTRNILLWGVLGFWALFNIFYEFPSQQSYNVNSNSQEVYSTKDPFELINYLFH